MDIKFSKIVLVAFVLHLCIYLLIAIQFEAFPNEFKVYEFEHGLGHGMFVVSNTLLSWFYDSRNILPNNYEWHYWIGFLIGISSTAEVTKYFRKGFLNIYLRLSNN